MNETVIGIDLGTTNTCAAYLDGDKPRMIPSEQGQLIIPSVVALTPNNRIVVGQLAKDQILINPQNTIFGHKRLIGRRFDSPLMRELRRHFHYEIVAGDDAAAAVRFGGKVMSLAEISALILTEVKNIARGVLQREIDKAVITVPAYYGENQRRAVREAGRIAGLEVIRLLNEPTAAALAFGFGKKITQRILIYDLGGGTFDVSVLELDNNVFEVIATGGDTFLGGTDFDTRVIDHVASEFHYHTGIDVRGDQVVMQRIRNAAEIAKCELSFVGETRLHLPYITTQHGKPIDLDTYLSRAKLNSLTRDLVEKSVELCEQTLGFKDVSRDSIDQVLLVGGQTRMPLVQQRIAEYFGREPRKNVHPEEVVAQGAAILGGSIGTTGAAVLIDVLPRAIGIASPGGRYFPVLERNMPVPASKDVKITVPRDRPLEIAVFQGESEVLAENEYLGTFSFGKIPPEAGE
ncbi:MAG: Hsp70 family protein, partial [Pseudomonadota bacterium]